MRYLISLLFLVVCFTANAQVQYREGYAIDTAVNATVSYLYPGGAASAAAAPDFKELGALEVVIVSDSLSGSTAGSFILQYCFDDACAYTYDAATLTINGATTQVSRTEDSEFTARKFRIKLAGSGTQTTQAQLWYNWKRKI